jgi:hypothetical protein
MTIHITPEPEYSYVSFETNVPVESYEEVITRVIDTFRPGKFVLTLFANRVRNKSPYFNIILISSIAGLAGSRCSTQAKEGIHLRFVSAEGHAVLSLLRLRSSLRAVLQIPQLRVVG